MMGLAHSIYLWLGSIAALSAMTSSGTIAPSHSAHRNIFAADIFERIAKQKVNNNVVFSPASIQTCLVLAALAAEGDTEREMRSALRLGTMEREAIAADYRQHIQTAYGDANNAMDARDDSRAELRMANRIFVNSNLDISKDFNELASKNFLTQAEKIDFRAAESAASSMNRWVEGATNNKIKNLIASSSLSADTSVLLINAIYFRAKWLIPFSRDSTHKADFHRSQEQKIAVDMMVMDEKVNYVDLPELQATALELPYANTDLSMLIVLPQQIDGLALVESKLAKMDLNDITNNMRKHDVDIFLPKFRIEFELDLKPILQQMGMNTMFSNAANFSRMVSSTQGPQKISEVRHKAFLDVNEAGSEAAAATFWKIVPMSLNLDQKTFKADHPFIFFIRSKTAVYFSGHDKRKYVEEFVKFGIQSIQQF